jgi:hypothetical protein
MQFCNSVQHRFIHVMLYWRQRWFELTGETQKGLKP